jgi:hypothetical protein
LRFFEKKLSLGVRSPCFQTKLSKTISLWQRRNHRENLVATSSMVGIGFRRSCKYFWQFIDDFGLNFSAIGPISGKTKDIEHSFYCWVKLALQI